MKLWYLCRFSWKSVGALLLACLHRANGGRHDHGETPEVKRAVQARILKLIQDAQKACCGVADAISSLELEVRREWKKPECTTSQHVRDFALYRVRNPLASNVPPQVRTMLSNAICAIQLPT